ncbi:MAG: ATP-binding cassette domain-containing protein [Ignavibacteriaceae bacterium]
MLKVNIDKITVSNNHTKHLLLKKIDFELFEGKVYTILGKNGTGKSTLIKSLTNLLNENIFSINGNIIWDKKNISDYDADELLQIRKNKIRYVFQDAANSFDPLKTFRYYFETSLADKNKIDELLEYFLLPDYNEISRLYSYEVSGGMAQRLSVILAFLAEPQLIILDEPTSGIDYAISNLLLLKIKKFTKKENKIVLIVTHDIIFSENVSDELALLSEGTLTQFKTKVEFFAMQDIDLLNSIKEVQ